MTNCVDIGIDGFVLPSTILMYRYATEPPCPLILTILALIAGVDMNGTREIAGLDMNKENWAIYSQMLGLCPLELPFVLDYN